MPNQPIRGWDPFGVMPKQPEKPARRKGFLDRLAEAYLSTLDEEPPPPGAGASIDRLNRGIADVVASATTPDGSPIENMRDEGDDSGDEPVEWVWNP
jgi:hypothetical protein